MKFGLFDHVDVNDRPLTQQLDERIGFVSAAEEAGFTVSVGGSTIIGFSLSGDYIGQSEGILTIVNFSANDNQACLDLGTGAFSNQNSQPIPVEFGECYDF